ncbi:hypothetical protein C9F11_26125 [Streptomyces sp. YIM 121038]|uniref:hypothetical protein n=1 Tax=Streptomyces sp. YIM 121038 TaxID=2136401 RepID=UPI0011103F12|nr:hypothetical protein [Streptomyces sp. YIM 121038]QCX78835.1 hypothetical protein C9F11_26125 [Streptomyces sp. YIM 121038]
MNTELERFVKTYLHYEQAYDVRGALRPTLTAFGEPFLGGVRRGFVDLLRERSATIVDYERLTDVDFSDESSLYDYLQGIYAYLFEGGAEQPTPPE